jgi:hypothetical protein
LPDDSANPAGAADATDTPGPAAALTVGHVRLHKISGPQTNQLMIRGAESPQGTRDAA